MWKSIVCFTFWGSQGEFYCFKCFLKPNRLLWCCFCVLVKGNSSGRCVSLSLLATVLLDSSWDFFESLGHVALICNCQRKWCNLCFIDILWFVCEVFLNSIRKFIFIRLFVVAVHHYTLMSPSHKQLTFGNIQYYETEKLS